MQSTQTFSVVFDPLIMANKIEELAATLQATFPEGTPKEIVNDLSSLFSNVLVSYGGSATGADGTKEVLIRLDVDGTFESLIATLRTGEIDFIHDYCTSFMARTSPASREGA